MASRPVAEAFAKAKHEEGMTLEAAALESARLRFRPILMTAFAFILGVIPLMKATGAGAGAQHTSRAIRPKEMRQIDRARRHGDRLLAQIGRVAFRIPLGHFT